MPVAQMLRYDHLIVCSHFRMRHVASQGSLGLVMKDSPPGFNAYSRFIRETFAMISVG